MPKRKECITVGKKIYCWNNQTKKIDVYIRKSMSIEECSPAIVTLLMELLGDKIPKNTEEKR